MNIIKSLEQTHQLEGVINSIRNDEYQEWLAPVIQYAEEKEESALGMIQQVIDHFCSLEQKKLGSV